MEKKENILAEMESARNGLNSAIETFGQQSEVYPEWTLKELMAHIAGWDAAVVETLKSFLAGDEFGTPADGGIDAYNAVSVEVRKDRSLADITKEYSDLRMELMGLLDGLTEEQYDTVITVPWGQEGTIRQMMSVFVHHEHEHAQELREQP